MIPIELMWLIIVLLFGLVGLVRGFLRELGVTTIMVVLLFGVTFLEARFMPSLIAAAARVAPYDPAAMLAALWIAVIGVAAFAAYHGQTLAFEGKLVAGALGVFFNASSGLVNGYLIAGSIWFYLDRWGYPLVGACRENLSAVAFWLVPMMPPSLLAPYLLYVAIFLVLMRVIR